MDQLPIIDAHVHLWDPSRLRLAWLDGNARLNRPFGPAQFRAAIEDLDVVGMVYLETDVDRAHGLLEARWAVGLAAAEPLLLGVVPFAPLEHGERCRAYLEALRELGPLVKGVRRIYQDAPADFCLQPDFVRGVQLLPEYGLSFDLCVRHRHLASTVELVRRCPDTQFILDHIGKPDIAAQQLDPWREHMRQLAALPNISCKISGVVTEADHADWTFDDIQPYVRHALEVFGPERVVFGGDWPVVLNASSYRRWVDTLAALTMDLPEPAQRALWADNARRFYRLGGITPSEVA